MSVADELNKLLELKKTGVLTDAEFNEQKKTLLSSGQSSTPETASQPSWGHPLLAYLRSNCVPFDTVCPTQTIRDALALRGCRDAWIPDLGPDSVVFSRFRTLSTTSVRRSAQDACKDHSAI